MHPEAYAIVTLFCNPSFRLVSGQGSARSAFESVPLIASRKSDVASNARQAFLLLVPPGRESGEGFEPGNVFLSGSFATFCFGKRKKPRIFVSKRRLCELYHIVH